MFDSRFRDQFRDLLVWRRDVRQFLTAPIAESTLDELMELITLCPSVGLSEPWRFVRVSSSERRMSIREEFQRANADALAGYEGEQRALDAKSWRL